MTRHQIVRGLTVVMAVLLWGEVVAITPIAALATVVVLGLGILFMVGASMVND